MSAALKREDAARLEQCVAAGGVAVFPSDESRALGRGASSWRISRCSSV